MASSTDGCVVDWRCALVNAYSAYFAREVARGVSEVPTFARFAGGPVVGGASGDEGYVDAGRDGARWGCFSCGVGQDLRRGLCGVDGGPGSGAGNFSEPVVDGCAGLQSPGEGSVGGEVGCSELTPNQRKRERRKARRARRRTENGSPVRGASWIASCDEAVQRDLRESRASMLVAQNLADCEKANALAKRLRLEREARVDEREFELRRQRLECNLAKVVDARFGDVTGGFAQTLIGELSEVSGIPTLSAGSVSPGSSVSVEVVVRMEKKLSELCQKVSELGAENGVLKERLGRALLREEGGVRGPALQDFNDVMRAYPEPSEVGDFVPPSDACSEDVRAFYDAFP